MEVEAAVLLIGVGGSGSGGQRSKKSGGPEYI
jgi:hypothetical protein